MKKKIKTLRLRINQEVEADLILESEKLEFDPKITTTDTTPFQTAFDSMKMSYFFVTKSDWQSEKSCKAEDVVSELENTKRLSTL